MQPSRAFLLRCWPEGSSVPDKSPIWRFRLQEIGGAGRMRSFASVERLLAFLQAEFGAQGDERGAHRDLTPEW